MILWLVLIIVAILVYLYGIKPFNYWKIKGIPYVPPWPLFGNMVNIFFGRDTFHGWEQKMYNSQQTRYMGLYFFHMPALLLRDADLIKQIAIKDFDHFVDHRKFISEDVDPLFGKNLFSLRGDKWRSMRATLSPAFTSSKMRLMFDLISKCAEQYTNYYLEMVPHNKPLDLEMKDSLARLANDIIATTAFGIECNSMTDKDNEFYLMGKDATDFSGWKIFKFIGFSFSQTLMKLLDVQVFSRKVSDFFRGIIKNTIAVREKEGIVRPDLIHLLMEARKGKLKHDLAKDEDAGFATVEESQVGRENRFNKIELSDDVITAQALLFFIAGFDAISTTMSQMAHELAIHEDVQRKLQQEIDEILNKHKGKVTYEVVMKMKYMDMVVSETLRKWPPVAALDRVCQGSYTIQPENPNELPLHLKKNDLIFLPVYAIHRDAKYYPDPDHFDPERFSDENKHNINPNAYFPFGIGPRNCIGSRFALLEMKTIFIYLLAKFNFVITEKSQVPIRYKKGQLNVMVTENGYWLGLERRK